MRNQLQQKLSFQLFCLYPTSHLLSLYKRS
nr:MAG TPA_asm: hypothetical protein [Bacteriophage sp.]